MQRALSEKLSAPFPARSLSIPIAQTTLATAATRLTWLALFAFLRDLLCLPSLSWPCRFLCSRDRRENAAANHHYQRNDSQANNWAVLACLFQLWNQPKMRVFDHAQPNHGQMCEKTVTFQPVMGQKCPLTGIYPIHYIWPWDLTIPPRHSRNDPPPHPVRSLYSADALDRNTNCQKSRS